MKPLNRPMFQRGGKVSSRNNGIVSGFDNGGRVGLENGGTALDYLEEMGLFEEPQRQKGLSTADYLRIASAGADIMGAQPTGRSGFIGALQAASPSLGSLGRDLASSSAAKEQAYQAKLAANRKLQAGAALSDFERQEDQAFKTSEREATQDYEEGLFDKEIEAQLEIAKLDKLEKQYIIEESAKIREKLNALDQTASPADKQALIDNLDALYPEKAKAKYRELEEARKEGWKKYEDLAEDVFNAIVDDTADEATKKAYGGKDAVTIATEMAIANVMSTYAYGANKAEGGRVGLQEGGDPMMAQQAQAQPQSNSVGLTFEELRARLPQEVTDGVVRLLATSEEALLAFANLETQEDIAQFNQKYNTDLQLPAQVA
tara:strand:- start:682 stop:1806 length:1125 start_codon:yes stop_codon:yes gene_type:complete